MSTLRRFGSAAWCLIFLGAGVVCADGPANPGLNASTKAGLKDGPALIFADGFESGDFSAWNGEVGDDSVIRMGAPAISVDESGASIDLAVLVANAGGVSVSVDWAVADGTAENGVDYSATGGTLEIPAGTPSGTISISILDDSLDELGETFSVILSNPTGASLGAPVSSIVTIADDDAPPLVALTSATATVGEETPTLELIVGLSAVSGLDVSVAFSSVSESALEGLDFTAATGTLVIPAGQTSALIAVVIVDDALDELDESFSVALSSPINATLGAIAASTVTIVDDDASPEVSFASTMETVDEGAGTLGVAVVLSAQSALDISVDYATADGTGTAGGDYTSTAGTLTIPAGESGGTIVVPIIDDGIDEPDEDLSLTLSNPVGAVLGAQPSVAVTIADDDAPPEISLAHTAVSVGEATPTLEIRVGLSSASGFDVTCDFATTDDTAAAGIDYTLSSGSVTILAGETTATVTVPIVDDELDELDETFSVALSNPLHATLVEPAVTVVTISDDDYPPEVSLSAEALEVGEGIGIVNIAVSLSAPSALDVMVGYSTAEISISSGVDFEPASGSLTIPAGEVGGSVAVTILDDDLDEPEEAFSFAIEGPGNAELGTVPSMVVTVVDDDEAPEIALASAAMSVVEGVGAVEMSVVLSGPSGYDTAVDYAMVDDTAFLGEDYQAPDGTVTIAAGELNGVISLSILDNPLDELEEAFSIVLSNPVNSVLAEPAAAVVTISDDDDPPQISWTELTSAVDEGVGSKQVGIQLSVPSALDVHVQVEGTDISALSGEDYSAVAETVTIAAGETSGTLIVEIIDDAIDEPEEEFVLALSPPQNAVQEGPVAHTIAIVDNDDPPQVAWLSEGVFVAEEAVTAELTVALSEPSALEVSVGFATVDDSAVGGEDFTPAAGTVIVPAGETSADVSIEITDDTDDELDESFSIALADPVNAVLGVPELAAVLITDNDLPVEVSFANATRSVEEVLGPIEFTVSLSRVSGRDISFEFVTVDGSALAGEDYLAAAGTQVIPAGELTATLSVGVFSDVLDEIDEEFSLRLENVESGVLGAPSEVVVTIVDDDLEPDLLITVSDSTVGEDIGQVVFTAELSVRSGREVTVTYVGIGGDGTAGEDFTGGDGVLVIPAGSVSASASVDIIDDGLEEYDEDFTIEFSPIDGAVLTTSSQLSVTIVDNDRPPIRRVIYSVGEFMGAPPTEATVTIASGIAVLSEWEGDELLPGHRLEFGEPSQVVYVLSCLDFQRCEVITPTGYQPPDVSSAPVVQIGYEFETVSAALEAAGDPDHLGTTDLVAARVALEIVCYATGIPETGPVVVDGWTTSVETPITIFADLNQRHFGTWTPGAHAIEVSGAPCIRTTVGNVNFVGLQLHCSAQADSNLTAIVLDGPGVSGKVEIVDSLIYLDGAEGAGDRLGVGTASVGSLELLVQNTVIVDAGSGSGRHAGLVVEEDSIAARIVNSTLLGGVYGLQRTAGTATVINTLCEGSSTACFDGSFSQDSHSNVSSDDSAPGSGSLTGVSGWLRGPLTSIAADAHLECNIFNLAAVTHSDFSSGSVSLLRDGDPRSHVKTASENPAFVQLDFGGPVTIVGTEVAFGYAITHEWTIAVADSVEDMGTKSGTYRLVVPARTASGADLPDPFFRWDGVDFEGPETARVVRLEVEKQDGGDSVHLSEWGLDFLNSPCDRGDDLSSAPGSPFATDVDSQWRIAPWDVGADEGSRITASFRGGWPGFWEVDGEAVVELELSRPSSSDLNLRYQTRSSSALEGADFSPVEGTWLIPAGQIRAELSIPLVEDGAGEAVEEFFLDVSAPDGGFGVPISNMVIINDDVPQGRVFLSNPSQDVDETAATATLEISLTELSGSDVTVWWRTEDGSALMGLDYGGSYGNTVIPAGQMTVEIDVPILDDEEVEEDETVKVNVYSVNGARLGSPSLGQVTILDNEPPVIRFVADSVAAVEHIGAALIGLELNKVVDHEVRVDFSSNGGTATLGSDYQPITGTVVIPPGETTGTFEVEIIDDPQPESDEAVTLVLTNPVGINLGDRDRMTLVIIDDDGTPSVVFDPSQLLVAEGDGVALLTVVISGYHSDAVTVEVSTADGTAVLGEDFIAPPSQVTIPTGQQSGVIAVPLLDDGEPEFDETFAVILSNPTNADLGEEASAAVVIVGDETQLRVRLGEAAIAVGEDDGLAVVEIFLDEAAPSEVGIRVSTSDGEARQGVDYVAFDEVVTFAAGEFFQSVFIEITNDDLYESAEAFAVTLSSPTGVLGLGVPWASVVTIHPSDSPPFVYLADGGFDIAHYNASEKVGEVSIPVRLSEPSGIGARVDYATTSGTATAGADYEEVAGTLYFPPGATEQLITIPIVNDVEEDGGEAFTISLSNASESLLDGHLPYQGVISITDVIPEVFFAKSVFYSEEGAYAWFEAVLSEPTVLPVEVGYRMVAGTAESGLDFHQRTGTMIVEAGATRSSKGWVFLYADDVVEDAESLSLVLENPVNGILGVPASAELMIVDGDTFQAYNLRALHIEHDLVHLAWGQIGWDLPSGAVSTGWELSRRDADLGGEWAVLADNETSRAWRFWRDFLVVGGTRYEYRVVPVYHPYGGEPHVGEESVWTMNEPVPFAAGEAAATIVPGFAEVVSTDEMPESANAFAGKHDYRFTLRPDPGPEFSNATVDVYVDETPADPDDDEEPQPWIAPYFGLARDDAGEPVPGSVRAVVGAPCDGPTCEVVVPDLRTGAHTLRFVITDASGTSQRAVVQDIHPWWGTVAESTTGYPLPVLHLYSDRVASYFPVLWFSGPVQPVGFRSLDHSDSVDPSHVRVMVGGDLAGFRTVGDQGLAAWSPVNAWLDETELMLGTSSSYSSDRELGRDILARGVSGQGLGGRQSLRSSGFFEYPVPVTVDLDLPDDNSPAVTWVTPALISENDAVNVWTDVWLRVEDHDQDLDPYLVTIDNLSFDGGTTSFRAHYADPSLQIRPEGNYGWFVCRMQISLSGSELANQLLIRAEDFNGNGVEEFGFTLTRYLVSPGDYPQPVISAPDPASYYGDGQSILMDATQSVVPEGYEVRFGALAHNGETVMPLAYEASGLSGSFTADGDVEAYVVRVVIAWPSSMPSDEEFRGVNLPCVLGSPDLGCTSAEVVIPKPGPGQPVPFELVHALPEQVMLRFGSEQPTIERSGDGGNTWHQVSSYEWWEKYFFVDTDVEEGAVYHYRMSGYTNMVYLGQTLASPGLPVEIPVWSAPRVVPELLDVEWHCPVGSALPLCNGTLSLGLVPEPGESLSGTTIRVFLNEPTRQLQDGQGEDLFIDWQDGLAPFRGRDVPACVVRSEIPDLEITVPENEDSITVSLDGVLFGANGLRFEVGRPGGGFSERGVLVALHEDPIYDTFSHRYAPLLPILFGEVVASQTVDLWGVGPASRYSPDCVDGDLTYEFSRFQNANDALYLNHLELEGHDPVLAGTDANGLWSHSWTVANGTYDFRTTPGRSDFYGYGFVGRVLLDGTGAEITDALAVHVYSNLSSAVTGMTVDSGVTDLGPDLNSVTDSLLLDSAEIEAPGIVRFRVTDADHDLPTHGVTVSNLSIASPAPVVAFYASDQFDPAGNWGWFVVELPLVTGENTLEFCAEDAAGNIFGTIEEPCVTATVVRESPVAFAVVTEPLGDLIEVRLGEVVSLDGSSSVVPPGGVGLWTMGERTTYLGNPWLQRTTMAPTTDFSDLQTVALMPGEPPLGFRARLVVAASLEDLPAELWPENGSLPCARSEGEGRCDAVDVRFDLQCNLKPDHAIVVVDQPSAPPTIGVDDPLQLTARVTAPNLEPFAFRWLVYKRGSDGKLWFETTIGSDDSGEGYSVENNDLVVTPGGQGLEPGKYVLYAEARYPATGCAGPAWYRGNSAGIGVTVSQTIDGIAPGKVVEGGTFRVYSRTWVEGLDGYVFIDDVIDDAMDPVIYFGEVQPGGYLEITPIEGELPAMAQPWWVSVADNLEGNGRSAWAGGLLVRAAGSPEEPWVVEVEEDNTCSGAGTECTHTVLPGQTWRGNWYGPGDEDFFQFVAGAGTVVRATLERAETTLPAQHPDAPAPELLLAAPGGFAIAASAPLGLNDTGCSLEATLTHDGSYQLVVRTPKGEGDYLVRVEVLAEGGRGVPAFGWSSELFHVTTEDHPTAHLQAPLFDGFGHPLSLAMVSWEQGADCGSGDFCANGTVVPVRSSLNGYAYLNRDPVAGEDPLWRPSTGLSGGTKSLAVRTAVVDRLAEARKTQPFIGRVETSSSAVFSTDLPDIETAAAITRQAMLRRAGASSMLKDLNEWCSHDLACDTAAAPVFRSVHLDLGENEELVDVQVRILEDNQPTERLDGHEIMSDVPLAVEAVASIRTGSGEIRNDLINAPIAVSVSDGGGGAVAAGGAVCDQLFVSPGTFTYRVGRNSALNFAYYEADGSSCCWSPTEAVIASVVAHVEVDDGQGEKLFKSTPRQAVAVSVPRPADPCEVRHYPAESPVIKTDYHSGFDPVDGTWDFASAGHAYLTDACGNIVHGVGLNDSASHTQPGDEFRIASPLRPSAQVNGVFAEVLPASSDWAFPMTLGGVSYSDSKAIPDGSYTIEYEVASDGVCSAGGLITGSWTVHAETDLPKLAVYWDWSWNPEIDPRGSRPTQVLAPGSAQRDATGAVAVWRVAAFDRVYDVFDYAGPYVDVPVRMYVVRRNRVPFDLEGNLRESYYEPVPGVVLCTGEVQRLTDSSGHVDWQSPVRTTCDTTWDAVASGLASSNPPDTAEIPAGPPNTWITWGLGVGIVNAPETPGTYGLVAEPLDESFRRGDSWMIEAIVSMPDALQEFEVGGVLFLDDGFVPVEPPFEVNGSRILHVVAKGLELNQGSVVDLEIAQSGLPFSSAQVEILSEYMTSNGRELIGRVELTHTGDYESGGQAKQLNPAHILEVPIWVSMAVLAVDSQPVEPSLELLGEFRYVYANIGTQVDEIHRRLIIERCPEENSGCHNAGFGDPGSFNNPQQVDDRRLNVVTVIDGWRPAYSDALRLFVRFQDPDDPSDVDWSDNSLAENGNDNYCGDWAYSGTYEVEQLNESTGKPSLISVPPDVDGRAEVVFQFLGDQEWCGGDNYVFDVQLAENSGALRSESWFSSGVLTAYKRLYLEIGGSVERSEFLLEDVSVGEHQVTLDWPWTGVLDNQGDLVGYDRMSQINVLTAVFRCAPSPGQGTSDSFITCDPSNPGKPRATLFDVVHRYGDPTGDVFLVDSLYFSPYQDFIRVELVERDGAAFVPYALKRDYDAGGGNGDGSATLALCTNAEGLCDAEVWQWWNEDPALLDFLREQFEGAFIEMEVSGNSAASYPHFDMREKTVDTSIRPLYREKWFTNSNAGSYGNAINLVFDNDFVPAGLLGATFSHKNVSFILNDHFSEETGPRFREFRHTVYHEILHQYRVAAPLNSVAGFPPDWGEHCNQTTLGYVPASGVENQDCTLTPGPAMFGDWMAPTDRVESFPCVYCLLGERPEVGSGIEDVGLRRRDGLSVDVEGNWNGVVP